MMKLNESEKKRLLRNYGPWALVTGGSSGIGREVAHHLAQAGLNLVLNARNAAALEEEKRHIISNYPVEVRVVAADVSTPAGLDAVMKAVAPLDVGLLVASAGFGTSGLFLEGSLHEERNMIEVNCVALMTLTHQMGQRMARRYRSGMILMSSLVAFQGVPYAANYAATKAYVQSLAEALAIELKPQGVDVLAAAPGPVTSGFGGRANMVMNKSLTPEQVGLPILRALGRKTVVLPGFLTKFLTYSLRTVPRFAKVRIMKIVMGGMTKHQRTALSGQH